MEYLVNKRQIKDAAERHWCIFDLFSYWALVGATSLLLLEGRQPQLQNPQVTSLKATQSDEKCSDLAKIINNTVIYSTGTLYSVLINIAES